MLNGGLLNWSVAPFGVLPNPLPLAVVVLVNTGLMAAVEGYRAKVRAARAAQHAQ